MGFSTGRYDGDMLVVETTHLKQGWVRRNGMPMSDRAKMTEYFVRNGEVMTHIFVLVDPVYLTEPLVKSQEFVRSTRELPAQTWLWVCDPVRRDCDARGRRRAGLPARRAPVQGRVRAAPPACRRSAIDGGAATMYPEFQEVAEEGCRFRRRCRRHRPARHG